MITLNSILKHLFRCAMEDQKQYLDRDELRDYRDALRTEEGLRDQLETLLEGEALHLFELFTKNCDKEASWNEFSSFRKGLAMGLRLGAFYTSEY